MANIETSEYLDHVVRVIERHLKAKRKTAYWLSKESGVSSSLLTKLLRGERKSLMIDTAADIAHTLGLTLSELIGDARR